MKRLQGTVTLPGSKSESNRALMIAAYGGFPLDVENLSCAHDTELLKTLLEQIQTSTPSEEMVVDCEDAGTVARFLMTYLAGKPGHWILTGNKRLCERPMAPLMDALRQLGADIAPGSTLPIKITGRPLKGGQVTLDASQSSQFASSLLMAAPSWEQGLQLSLTGNPVSVPYIEMTIKMMACFGVEVVRNGNEFIVAHQTYRPFLYVVSADWSAASYWYEMMALSEGGTLLLEGLRSGSPQGDAVVADLYKPLGINTEFVEKGVQITSIGAPLSIKKPLEFDFSNTPDLFPSILVSCVALQVDTVFYGISTLFIKESDRVNSLISELSKYYTFINIIDSNKLVIHKSSLLNEKINNRTLSFCTFGDHRIAMALAGLQVRLGMVMFDRPDVVNKSYPTIWDDVEHILRK